MNYYTSTIPPTLAEKLKEKGMPMEEGGKSMIDWKVPTYADTLDWIWNKEVYIDVHPYYGDKEKTYRANVVPESIPATINTFFANSWHEAANAAIEKALTLI